MLSGFLLGWLIICLAVHTAKKALKQIISQPNKPIMRYLPFRKN